MASETVEEEVGVNVLEEVVEFVSSSRFVRAIEDFKADHLYLFSDLSDQKSGELQEQRLEHYDAFLRFQALVDRLFEDFNEQHKLTTAMLLESCRHAIDGDFMPIFEEDPNKAFVEDVLLSWLDYDAFLAMMAEDRGNRRTAQARARHK
jgi:hypothetical protein